MRIARFAWCFLGTFLRSRRDPGARAFRADLGDWVGDLDPDAQAARAAGTWNHEPTPRVRLLEMGGRDHE